jgi:hypothetical protein
MTFGLEWFVGRGRRGCGRASAMAGGVKVERPQPQARTYDLDAGAGRRRLNVDDRVQLSPAGRAGFASVPSVRLLRMGQARLPRHLFAPQRAHDAIGATTRPGSLS